MADGPLLVDTAMLTIENGPTAILGLVVFLLLAHILYPTKEGTSETPHSHPVRRARRRRLTSNREQG